MRYLFILNPISGGTNRADRIQAAVEKQFADSGHEVKFIFTEAAGDAVNKAAYGVTEAFDVVVAAGGDGTINEVAGALTGTASALGIIPLGSGNGYARSMGIPMPLDESIRLLREPSFRMVDVGIANQRVFVGVCGVGLDAIVSYKFQEFGTRGPLPYFIVGTREYFKYHPETYIVEYDDKKITVNPMSITVANTEQFGNGAIIARGARPDDGLLEVCITEHVGFLATLRLTHRMFNGTMDADKHYHRFQCRQLSITGSKRSGAIHTDGEPWQRGEKIEITIRDRALKVCVAHTPEASETK
jgi:diacylglycerol kinase (ATP)